MKKSKAASTTARMSRTTKQQLSQQPQQSSNNENDISFGNAVAASGEFIIALSLLMNYYLVWRG